MHLSLNFRTSLAIILAMFAVAAYAQSPDGELIIPERRRLNWRKWLHPGAARRDSEQAGAAEAEEFIQELTEQDHGTQPLLPMPGRRQPGRHRQVPNATIKYQDLPSFRPTRVLRDPGDPSPPWDEAGEPAAGARARENTQASAIPEEKPQRELDTWAPGDPGEAPTIIREGVIPAIKGDLLKYLDSLRDLGNGRD